MAISNYELITNLIIEAIEKGAGEFKMPWNCGTGLQPKNVATGKPYKGVNILTLWAQASSKGYTDALWGTFKQWADKGASVRKGEKASYIVFWKPYVKTVKNEQSGEDETKAGAVMTTSAVFNVAQVDGYTSKILQENDVKPLESAELLLNKAKMALDGSAYYRISIDTIFMPPMSSFFTQDGYYATLCHEYTHWTGHESRLNRKLANRFGSEAYAMEELIAELGSAFLCANLGISSEPRADHANYLAGWLQVLKRDSRAIFTAASAAQAAVDYLQGL